MYVSEKILFETAPLVVSYTVAEALLRVRWLGHHDAESVREYCQLMLAHLPVAPCSYMINDSSEAYGEWWEAAEWIGRDFAPQLADRGVRAIAWIQSMDWPSRQAIASTLPHIQGVEVRTFDFDEQRAAHAWLMSRSV